MKKRQGKQQDSEDAFLENARKEWEEVKRKQKEKEREAHRNFRGGAPEGRQLAQERFTREFAKFIKKFTKFGGRELRAAAEEIRRRVGEFCHFPDGGGQSQGHPLSPLSLGCSSLAQRGVGALAMCSWLVCRAASTGRRFGRRCSSGIQVSRKTISFHLCNIREKKKEKKEGAPVVLWAEEGHSLLSLCLWHCCC